MAAFTIKRLNHLVLWVRDAQRSLGFYRDVLGFTIVEMPSPQAVFLRANGSDNHHDLGLFGIGPDAPPPSQGRQVGMYHAAWEVATIEDLAKLAEQTGHMILHTESGAAHSYFVHEGDMIYRYEIGSREEAALATAENGVR